MYLFRADRKRDSWIRLILTHHGPLAFVRGGAVETTH